MKPTPKRFSIEFGVNSIAFNIAAEEDVITARNLINVGGCIPVLYTE